MDETLSVEYQQNLLSDSHALVQPGPPRYLSLELQADTSTFRCCKCHTTGRQQQYYTLPCGHVLDEACVTDILTRRRLDLNGVRTTALRQCPECAQSWGQPLPSFLYTPNVVTRAPLNICMKYATQIRWGFEILCQSRADAMQRLHGEHRPFLDSEGTERAVVSFDTGVWVFLGIGQLLPDHYEFDKTMSRHWGLILHAAQGLLLHDFKVMQGSNYQLAARLRYGIFAELCKQSPYDFYDESEPLSYDAATLAQYTEEQDGVDADLLWRLMDPDDAEYRTYLNLLIASLVEAGQFCRLPVKLMPLGVVEEAECAICCCNERSVSLPCGHCFGHDCLQTWWDSQDSEALNRRCPICRSEWGDRLSTEYFNLDYDKLSALVEKDVQQYARAMQEVRTPAHGIFPFHDQKFAALLYSNQCYLITIDSSLFPIMAASKYILTTMGVEKDAQFFRVITAAMCHVLQTTCNHKEGTPLDLLNKLKYGIVDLLFKVYKNRSSIEDISDEVVRSISQHGDDQGIWTCVDIGSGSDTLCDSVHALIMYAISRCPKSVERARFGTTGR